MDCHPKPSGENGLELIDLATVEVLLTVQFDFNRTVTIIKSCTPSIAYFFSMDLNGLNINLDVSVHGS